MVPVPTIDGHCLSAFRGAQPENTQKENPMTTLKLVRAYGRYLAGSLATIAFKLSAN
ncbi:MAG: hypothetical protein ACRDJH_21690 [Thermomicrobiales bacterium]